MPVRTISSSQFKWYTLFKRIVAFGLLLAMIIVVVTFHAPLSRAVSLATTHQPERFTELYFNNPVTLPRQVRANIPATFSFHVTNHLAARTVYHYRIIGTSDTTPSRDLGSGTISIADGSGADTAVTFSLPISSQAMTITVQLVNNAETISFRTTS